MAHEKNDRVHECVVKDGEIWTLGMDTEFCVGSVNEPTETRAANDQPRNLSWCTVDTETGVLVVASV